jgi:twitching motility protein PilT
MDYRDRLNNLLVAAAKENASDLHIAVGRRPTLRIDGVLVPLEKEAIVTPETAEGLVMGLMNDAQKEEFSRNHQVDLAYSFEDKARFRVNVYSQKGYVAAALRLIPSRIRSVEELSLPPLLHDFAKLSQGFVLVVGPAGHGKSTTLAAILDEINHTRADHIITIEDPIEYLFTQDRSIISQREVRSDVATFHAGLRTVLRQDPDVIMIGEMRDGTSIASRNGPLGVFNASHKFCFANNRSYYRFIPCRATGANCVSACRNACGDYFYSASSPPFGWTCSYYGGDVG